MNRLVAIVGPTAAGKTAAALQAALQLGGEIVNADSRLFYRGFDTGTAKPTTEERALVPHHLIDVLGANETMGLARFIDSAAQAIEEINSRGRLPLLVGGSGQYVWGLLEGWDVPRVPPDRRLREDLEDFAAREGWEPVHARLAALDPEAAGRIDPRNVRRVIRAIEVAQALGPGAQQGRAVADPYRSLVIGITIEREALYRRIDRRIDAMIEAGWANEVAALISGGVSANAPAFAALGYREIAAHVAGEMPLLDAVAEAKRATRRLVRHQYSWFALNDERITWVDGSKESAGKACIHLIQSWLRMADSGVNQ